MSETPVTGEAVHEPRVQFLSVCLEEESSETHTDTSGSFPRDHKVRRANGTSEDYCNTDRILAIFTNIPHHKLGLEKITRRTPLNHLL